MNRQQAMTRIRELSFMLNDISLFLDTNPNNQQALASYGKYRDMLAEAVEYYEQNFAPLTSSSADKCGKWSWLEHPWPWEKEAN